MSSLTERRQEWERLRSMPLEDVARRTGYVKDRYDRKKWRSGTSVISINGTKFFDHLACKGGGGAIDLVIHAQGCSFQEACDILGDWMGTSPGGNSSPLPPPTPRHRTEEIETPKIPEANEVTWQKVCHWLVNTRCLDETLLETCRKRNLLHADARGNAVFLCRNAAGDVTGAEIVGPQFKGMASGSRKARGSFHIGPEHVSPTVAVLTESALDALSFHALAISPPDAVVASVNGTAAQLPEWMGSWSIQTILCAYDADDAGESAAVNLARSDPRTLRIKPTAEKDWNDVLIRRATPG